MKILIVESNAALAALWARPLVMAGHAVEFAGGQATAVAQLQDAQFDAIILNLTLSEGSALAVADFANYKQPAAKVLAVTADRYFSDGSIFAHLSNASALLSAGTAAEDIGKMVEFYAA